MPVRQREISKLPPECLATRSEPEARTAFREHPHTSPLSERPTDRSPRIPFCPVDRACHATLTRRTANRDGDPRVTYASHLASWRGASDTPARSVRPAPLGPCSYGARPEEDAPERWLGVTLVRRDAELGVVGHVTRGVSPDDSILHAFGGLSGSLEYRVPAAAIERLLGVSARAVVDDRLEFAPTRLCVDGTVILAPRDRSRQRAQHSTGTGIQSPWPACMSMPTMDTSGRSRPRRAVPPGDAAAFLVVVVRPWLGRSHRLRIPARRVLAVNPQRGFSGCRVGGRDLRAFTDTQR